MARAGGRGRREPLRGAGALAKTNKTHKTARNVPGRVAGEVLACEAAAAYRKSHAGCTLHNACMRSFVAATGGYKNAMALYRTMKRNDGNDVSR